jgi:putative membrane protein
MPSGKISPVQTLPATGSAAAVAAVGLLLAGIVPAGPMSAHMGLHILLMNIAAPLLAAFFARRLSPGGRWASAAWITAIAQMLLLWLWHAPMLQREVMQSPTLQIVMQASLFAAAFGFWLALLLLPSPGRWQAIPTLLLSGKLSCLLAVLLIFAPRLLFDSHALGFQPHRYALEDQQLAGLLMAIACPLSYVVAGVIFAAQILRQLEEKSLRSPRPPQSVTG